MFSITSNVTFLMQRSSLLNKKCNCNVLTRLKWIYLEFFYCKEKIMQTYIFQDFGTFGYNCRIGKCDFVAREGSNMYPRVFLYGVGFTVPCILTVLSYGIIWWYVWCNDKYLKNVGGG